MDEITKYLKQRGPSLSSEISDHLAKTLRISGDAARKRVSRLPDGVKRLGFITFPRKARFIYHEQQFGSELYWERLIAALQQTNSAYGYAIAGLRLRNGIVPADTRLDAASLPRVAMPNRGGFVADPRPGRL